MKRLTVVITFSDDAFYNRALRFLKDRISEKKNKRFEITAMSIEDEMTKLDMLEDAINNNDLLHAKSILQMDTNSLLENKKDRLPVH